MDFLIQTVIRALAAVVVGSLIGSERAKHGRAAGMRTHILVCLGACMTALTSVYISKYYGDVGDIMRLPAQVISGVGFLGAGMIVLKNNNTITGLTTAAGVWATATIGIALGYGYYLGAAVVTALFLGTIILFARFERKRKSAQVIYLEIEDRHKVNETLKALTAMAPAHFTYQVFAPKSGNGGSVGLNMVFERRVDLNIDEVSALPNVAFAVEE